jgi:hypothetical protein
MALTIAIDRTSLGLGPLTITGSRAAAHAPGMPGLWVPADGYRRPTLPPRLSYAPESAYAPGRTVLAATVSEGTWPLRIRAAAPDAATLAALRAVVELAVGQMTYDVAVSLDGVMETWRCRYAVPVWPASEHWQRLGHEDAADITIPVRP